MDRQMKPQNAAQKSAQKHFTKAAQDGTLAKQTREKERAANTAKTAKLRELRLAKEAADKEEAGKLATQDPGANPSARHKRGPAARSAGMVRMRY